MALGLGWNYLILNFPYYFFSPKYSLILSSVTLFFRFFLHSKLECNDTFNCSTVSVISLILSISICLFSSVFFLLVFRISFPHINRLMYTLFYTEPYMQISINGLAINFDLSTQVQFTRVRMRTAKQSGEVGNVKLMVSLIRCSSAGLLRLEPCRCLYWRG